MSDLKEKVFGVIDSTVTDLKNRLGLIIGDAPPVTVPEPEKPTVEPGKPVSVDPGSPAPVEGESLAQYAQRNGISGPELNMFLYFANAHPGISYDKILAAYRGEDVKQEQPSGEGQPAQEQPVLVDPSNWEPRYWRWYVRNYQLTTKRIDHAKWLSSIQYYGAPGGGGFNPEAEAVRPPNL